MEARLREYYKPNMANQAAFNENEHYGLNMAQKLNAVRAHQLQQNRLPVRFGLIYILLTLTSKFVIVLDIVVPLNY